MFIAQSIDYGLNSLTAKVFGGHKLAPALGVTDDVSGWPKDKWVVMDEFKLPGTLRPATVTSETEPAKMLTIMPVPAFQAIVQDTPSSPPETDISLSLFACDDYSLSTGTLDSTVFSGLVLRDSLGNPGETCEH